MSDNVIQSSFASGELSPSLFARVDIAKYHSGAATMRNFFVDYRSGASTRTGTEFIRPATIASRIRLVRFQQDVNTTYILEFSEQLLRFITQGSSVVETPIFITQVINNGQLMVGTQPGGSWAVGQLVFITGVVGMPQINNRYFLIGAVPDPNDIILNDPFSNLPIVPYAGWPTFGGGGTVARVYSIATPYHDEDLRTLKFSQKGNIMNITSNSYPLARLQLNSATNWVLTINPTIGSTATVPTGLTATISNPGTGTSSYMYLVTSVDINHQESQGSVPDTSIVSGPDLRLDKDSVTLTWTAAAGAVSYNVYKAGPQNGTGAAIPAGTAVGFIGSTTGTTFIDGNIAPDFSQTPPIHQDPFNAGIIHPGCSAYFQQRLTLANGGFGFYDQFWMSKPAVDLNFDISNPSEPDDAISARLVSLEVNEIKNMIPMPAGLIMLTTKGAWQVSGGAGGVATQGGPITPATLTATSQAYVGANDVAPILINYDIIFVQQKGSVIRDLTYNIYANIYTGTDISILSNHLFYGHQVVEWAYAEEPFKIVWAVREDGILLGLTMLKEQDMFGWSRHDSMGNFESVATVTEGTVDATYVVINRPSQTAPGAYFRYIERIMERTFPFGAEDSWSVDSGVKTTQNEPGFQLEATTPDPVTNNVGFFSPNPGSFGQQQLGQIVRYGGGIFKVIQVVSDQEIIGQTIQPITNLVPDDPFNRPALAPAGTWSIDQPFQTFFGLDHLEGYPVSVLADGGVVNGITVKNGQIALSQPATKVLVGLGFQAQLQTMPLDMGQETNTVQGKRKKVAALTVRVKDSRGAKAGRTFQSVVPIKELNRTTILGTSSPLITRDERIVMDPLWDVPGQVCIQVDDPLPVTVLGVVPEIIIGDTPK